MTTIIRAAKGTGRHEVALEHIVIPDLWGVAVQLKAEGRKGASKQVLECWHLCHDLLAHLRGETS